MSFMSDEKKDMKSCNIVLLETLEYYYEINT